MRRGDFVRQMPESSRDFGPRVPLAERLRIDLPLIGILLLGGAGAAWMFLKPKPKKATWESVSEREPSPMTFGGGTGPESRSGPEFVSSPMDAPKPRPRPASAGGGQAGSATKSASKPTAPGVAATPKPQPKPPTPPSNT